VKVASALTVPGETAPVLMYLAVSGTCNGPFGESPINHWFVLPGAAESGPNKTGVPALLSTWMPIPFAVESVVNRSVLVVFVGLTLSVNVIKTFAPVTQGE
jgi:hypothetical protein